MNLAYVSAKQYLPINVLFFLLVIYPYWPVVQLVTKIHSKIPEILAARYVSLKNIYGALNLRKYSESCHSESQDLFNFMKPLSECKKNKAYRGG